MAEIINGYVFYEIAALLVLAAIVGMIGLKLRQPLIVSFIAVGIIAGPSVLGIAISDEYISLMGELGIAILLFLVGLKLDINLVRSLGPVALITGIGQMAGTFAFGILIASLLGFDFETSILIAVTLCFSSTIIIVKLLSDKREIDSLHGRIALGVLIVQDIAVVIAMIVISGLGNSDGGSTYDNMLQIAGFGALMLLGVWGFVKFIANKLTERLASNPELLLSFVIGWAALLASVGHYYGLGKELGGLLAGVSLASTSFREAIAARLSSLRDFLLLFFFVSLGASLNLAGLGANLVPALILSLFVLFGKPAIVLILVNLQGYSRRAGILSSLTLAQISEFSLIFISMAVTVGFTSGDTLSLITLVALITIAISSSAITFSHHIYGFLEKFLDQSDADDISLDKKPTIKEPQQIDVIIIGLGRYGFAIAKALQRGGKRVIGMDFNPEAIKYAKAHDIEALYGDATDPEFVSHLPLAHANWVVSAVPEHEDMSHEDPGHILIKTLKTHGFNGNIAIGTHSDDSIQAFEAAGADLILLPYRDAAIQAADLILEDKAPERFKMVDPAGQKELV